MSGPQSPLDGVVGWIGLRWDDAQTVRLTIRDELVNQGGMLSGPIAYAIVDYCMGSTLWAQRNPGESIATISIAMTYLQSATEGEVICRSVLDRRNRTTAALRSEVHHEDGRLLYTAQGHFAIFQRRGGEEPVAVG